MPNSTNKPNSRQVADRRSEGNRRSGYDRRRNAEPRTAIIHVTDSVLRVVIRVQRATDQQHLAICRSLVWRDKAKSLHSPQGIAELTAAMTTLVAEERLAGARARVLLSGDACVTRAVTGVVDDVQREAYVLRERSQLYLSLGAGKKVVATSSTPLDARHSHALLTVATEQTLQVVSQAVEAAGMELEAIGSAQVALARLVNEGRSQNDKAKLVVVVDEGRVELGIMKGGRLFLDYRPGGGARVDQLAEILGQHHPRLTRYCQRHHGLEGDELSHALVCGAPKDAEKAAASIASLQNLDVELLSFDALSLPWELRGEGLRPEMAAVVGAALGLSGEADEQGPNLVDELISSVRPAMGRALFWRCAPLAAALLIGVVFGVLSWSTKSEVAAMKAELDLLSPKAARAARLRLDMTAAENELNQLEALSQRITRPPVSLWLTNLTQTVPADVWLSDVSLEAGQVAHLAGISYAESSVYDFVGHLNHLPGVGQVALQGTGVGRTHHRTATTFDIHLDLKLSGETIETEKESL